VNAHPSDLPSTSWAPQVPYASYDLAGPGTYSERGPDTLRRACGICQKHHRIVCCQIPYTASRAVQES
jgi:hypothetical protein